MALVPLTVVMQRLVPIVSAHASSNSLTTPARDQTPLRMVSITRPSSVAGFQTGHLGQLAVLAGSPPSIAGRSLPCAGRRANSEGAAPMERTVPAPKIEFCLMKSRLEYCLSFFDITCGIV